MKRLIRIYKWIVISIILQCLLLFYINNAYLKRDSIKVNIDDITNRFETDAYAKIPEMARDIKVSFDGNYLCYILDDELKIIDAKNNKIIKIISQDMDVLSFYRWLPDRNMIIYSLRGSDYGNTGNITIFTYDVSGDVERDYPSIKGITNGSEVVGIELSPLTNIIYAKIKTSGEDISVYKYNIMNNLSYVMPANVKTVIKETLYKDNLVYQSKTNKLYVRDGTNNSTKSLKFKNKMALIDIDAEDKIYVGEINESNEVTKIYYGKLTDEIKNWQQLTLDKPLLAEKIIITRSGGIFELSEEENTIYDLQKINKVTYKGKFLELSNDMIASMEDNKLCITNINATSQE